MSANDGGPAIRFSRTPVERPVIPRGEFILPIDGEPALACAGPGDRVGFVQDQEWRDGSRYRVSYHDAEVVGRGPDKIRVQVGPETVVTWERT